MFEIFGNSDPFLNSENQGVNRSPVSALGNDLDMTATLEKLEDTNQPADKIEEMFLNFNSDGLKILYDRALAAFEDENEMSNTDNALEDRSELKSFDGNDSMDFDNERKQAFVDFYNLEFLCERDDVAFKDQYYVAPNNTVIKFMLGALTGSLQFFDGNNIGYRPMMSDVIKILDQPEVNNNYAVLLKEIFSEEILFPQIDAYPINYERIYEMCETLGETPITDELKKNALYVYETLCRKCDMVEKPVSGQYVRRVNVNGDRSYSDSVIRVEDVYNTYVSLKVLDNMSSDGFDTSLFDFWNNFECIDTAKVSTFLKDIFWEIFDDELYDSLLKRETIDREPKPVLADDDLIVFHNESFRLSIHFFLSDQIGVALRVRLDESTNSRTAIGTIMDLPLVLNYLNTGRYNTDPGNLERKFKQYNKMADVVCHMCIKNFDKDPEIMQVVSELRERLENLRKTYQGSTNYTILEKCSALLDNSDVSSSIQNMELF